jgi:glycosyltransferase involved in cell wall biosynthesis
MAHDLNLGCDVEALGEQEHVIPLLSVSDLFLLPSATESFGLAALEAMACSVPVIASKVGGLPEVIEHGVTGFLHPPDDLQGMADSGIALLSDAELHAATAKASRARAEELFCAKRVVPQYEAYYREVVATRSR